MKKKKAIIACTIIGILLVLRAVAPSVILNHVNKKLATFSPLYAVHIGDLDLHFFRMAYTGQDVTAVLKKENFQFLRIDAIDTSLAIRELFKGKFVVDVDVKRADMKLTTATVQAVSGFDPKQVKNDAKTVKDATIPFDLERMRVMESKVLFSDLGNLPPEQGFRMTDVEAVASNLTPKEKEGMSIFTAMGTMQETAKIKLVGQAKPNLKPADWSANVELRSFDLRKINALAKRMIPFTFKTGDLSLYAATQSVKGNVHGYVKPFFKHLVMIGDHSDFKNAKQFIFEILGTVGNFLLQNRKNDALATKVEFKTVNGKLEVATTKAVMIAIENAFGDPLSPSIDETLDLQ